MKTTLNNGKNGTLCIPLCFVTIVYIVMQLVYAAGFLPANRFFIEVFYHRYVPPPYITLLASILTPKTDDINKPCIWRLFHNRSIMNSLENMLEDPARYAELHEFITEEFDVCIYKTATETSNASLTEPIVEPEIKHSPCFISAEDLIPVSYNISFGEILPTFDEIEENYPQLQSGGFYPGPSYCKRPRNATVIIIPYRKRRKQLKYFLNYTIGVLIQQQLSFQIVVVEQDTTGVFNKGQLMNTGFKWIAKNTRKWDCYVFHDVDMISEHPGTFYTCGDEKKIAHFSPFVDKFNYRTEPPTGITIGGAVGFTEWQFRAVNGYSNAFWGWGGEDDDMNIRLRVNGFGKLRPKLPFGKYTMLPHDKDQENPNNSFANKMLKTTRRRMPVDGLSSLATVIQRVDYFATHTRLLVTVTHPGSDNTGPSKTKKSIIHVRNDVVDFDNDKKNLHSNDDATE